MADFLTRMITEKQPRDPRTCTTEAEIDQAFAEMAVEAEEYDRHVNSLRGGVPRVLADLHQTIALNQLARMRRLGGA